MESVSFKRILCSMRLKSKHLLSRGCTCNLLVATWILGSANLPFGDFGNKYVCLVPSEWWLSNNPSFPFPTKNNLLKKPANGTTGIIFPASKGFTTEWTFVRSALGRMYRIFGLPTVRLCSTVNFTWLDIRLIVLNFLAAKQQLILPPTILFALFDSQAWWQPLLDFCLSCS